MHPEILEEYHIEPCNLKAEMSASVSACINNSGKFKGKVRFSFLGIGYSFSFSFTLNSSEASPAYDFKEIPLDEVPLENRFGLESLVR
jgi:hypothetical protein